MNEIRDPIYGFIIPSKKELKIIDTPLFQRLRRIKQLALAYLVYPGALHTRFDHSLGVYHVASKIADQLLPGRENEENRAIVRYAALLHDVGHGPFSHVSEPIFNKFFKYKNVEKVHEAITFQLIQSDDELNKILSSTEIKQIINLLNGDNVNCSIMKEIVSSPIDADKMDYLLRDSYFCGVKYGVFDYERLLNTLDYYKDGQDKHIAVRYDGVNSLEQFVLAKYYMTRQIYRHKIRILTDSMITRGLELGIEDDENPFLKKLFTYSPDDEYLKNYLKYFDEKVFSDILSYKRKGKAFEIFNRLHHRNLFKRIFSEKLKDTDANPVIKDKLIHIQKNEKLRKKIESSISQLISPHNDQAYIIANTFKFNSVKEISGGNSEEKLIILTPEGIPTDFQNESNVFNSINESMNDVYFEVYAPVFYDTPVEKEKLLKKCKIEINRILKDLED